MKCRSIDHGQVDLNVIYKLDANSDSLIIDFNGNVSQSTPLDLASHFYFNLEGQDSGKKIYDHKFRIYSNYFLEADESKRARLRPVESTRNDLRELTRLADRIDQSSPMPSLFDTYYVLDQQTGQKIVAT